MDANNRRISLLIVFLLMSAGPAGGCATGPAAAPDSGAEKSSAREGAPLEKRVSYELQCDADAIEWTQFDKRTWGVRGCGKQAIYVADCMQCNVGNSSYQCDCTYRLDSFSEFAAPEEP